MHKIIITVPEIKVTNQEKLFNLSRVGVEHSLTGITPLRVTKYGVAIRGQEYPLRQIVAVATGTPQIEWSTANAYRVLHKLGFEIIIH